MYHKKSIVIILFFIFSLSLQSQNIHNYIRPIQENLKELTSKELLQKAKISFQNSDYNRSIQYLSEFLERNPNHIQAKVLFIKSLIFIKQFHQALNMLRTLEKEYPDHKIFPILKAMIFLQQGKKEEVETMISQLENHSLQIPEFWLLKGDYYVSQNEYQIADFYYKKFLLKNPDNQKIHLKRIQIDLNQKKFASAKQKIKDFKTIFKNNLEYYKISGDYYYQLYLHQLFRKNNITSNQEILTNAYLNYKTYLNYISFDKEIWNQLLYISYLLKDKEKIQNLLKEYPFIIKDTLLASNLEELLHKKDPIPVVEKLCKENQIPFSCLRYEFLLIHSNEKLKKFKRMKFHLSQAKQYKQNFSYRLYNNHLFWAKQLYPAHIPLIKEFLHLYKSQKFYEDYYHTLQTLILKDKNNPIWKYQMERFLQNTKKILLFKIFKTTPVSIIQSRYQRKKKKIVIFNPYPIERMEHHFKESELIRNLLNLFINQLSTLQTVSESDWKTIKIRFSPDPNHYLFYFPEIIPIIQEWEKETNQNIDFFLESFYRILPDRIIFTIYLRNSNGISIKKETFEITHSDAEFQLLSRIQEMLLQNIPIEANFLLYYQDKILINAGKVDGIQKDQIFKFQNNYYAVDTTFPYVSLLRLIKGKPIHHKKGDIFIKVSF